MRATPSNMWQIKGAVAWLSVTSPRSVRPTVVVVAIVGVLAGIGVVVRTPTVVADCDEEADVLENGAVGAGDVNADAAGDVSADADSAASADAGDPSDDDRVESSDDVPRLSTTPTPTPTAPPNTKAAQTSNKAARRRHRHGLTAAKATASLSCRRIVPAAVPSDAAIDWYGGGASDDISPPPRSVSATSAVAPLTTRYPSLDGR